MVESFRNNFGPDVRLPPLPAGSIVATGHTHIPAIERRDAVWCFNPGSIALPKGGFGPTYAILEGRSLAIRRLSDGTTLRAADLS